MIRYVLAVVLTVAILGMSVSAVQYGAGATSERQVAAEVAAIDHAATSLLEEEELPPVGQPGPRRVVTVSLPEDSMTSAPTELFELERTHESHTTVRYRIEDRTIRQTVIDAPIVFRDASANRSLELEGAGVETTFHLTLERDDSNEPVVVISRARV